MRRLKIFVMLSAYPDFPDFSKDYSDFSRNFSDFEYFSSVSKPVSREREKLAQ